MSTTTSIIIGIIAGIITTLILELSRRIFFKIVIPWYQALVYKGIDISGEWVANIIIQKKGEKIALKRKLFMSIDQKGHKITGDFTIQNILENESINSVSSYKLSGKISDNYVCLNYARKSQKKIGLGNLLFKVTGLGDRLVGNGTFLNSLDEINSHKIFFDRKK